MLAEQPDAGIKVFVIWERVLGTDWGAPSSVVLGLMRDRRAAQFWDPRRSLSHRLGEKDGDRKSIVWDWVALYPPGLRWDDAPPAPAFTGRPVEDVIGGLRDALWSARL